MFEILFGITLFTGLFFIFYYLIAIPQPMMTAMSFNVPTADFYDFYQTDSTGDRQLLMGLS